MGIVRLGDRGLGSDVAVVNRPAARCHVNNVGNTRLVTIAVPLTHPFLLQVRIVAANPGVFVAVTNSGGSTAPERPPPEPFPAFRGRATVPQEDATGTRRRKWSEPRGPLPEGSPPQQGHRSPWRHRPVIKDHAGGIGGIGYDHPGIRPCNPLTERALHGIGYLVQKSTDRRSTSRWALAAAVRAATPSSKRYGAEAEGFIPRGGVPSGNTNPGMNMSPSRLDSHQPNVQP